MRGSRVHPSGRVGAGVSSDPDGIPRWMDVAIIAAIIGLVLTILTMLFAGLGWGYW